MSVETSLPEAGTLRDKPEMGADSARIVVLWPEVLLVHKGSMLCCRLSIVYAYYASVPLRRLTCELPVPPDGGAFIDRETWL
jgi:hypothetical protein